MKKVLALLLSLVMLLSFTACGGNGGDNGDITEPTDDTQVTEPAPVVQEVSIGDHHVRYDGAKKFAVRDNEWLMVLYTYTNNSTEEAFAAKNIFIPVKQNGETVSGIAFLEEDQPDFYGNEKVMIAPGESIQCIQTMYLNPEGTIEVTFMDMYHTIPDKLVVEIDPATLETYVSGE